MLKHVRENDCIKAWSGISDKLCFGMDGNTTFRSDSRGTIIYLNPVAIEAFGA